MYKLQHFDNLKKSIGLGQAKCALQKVHIKNGKFPSAYAFPHLHFIVDSVIAALCYTLPYYNATKVLWDSF